MTTPQRGANTIVASGDCRYCGGVLPEGRRITFCPHCGQNLTIQHCPACSTELELGWKFCTTCGRSVTGAEAAAARA
jgi:predicted amidophosphoribosyltransferase